MVKLIFAALLLMPPMALAGEWADELARANFASEFAECSALLLDYATLHERRLQADGAVPDIRR